MINCSDIFKTGNIGGKQDAVRPDGDQVAPGDEIRVRLAQDELLAAVNEIVETS